MEHQVCTRCVMDTSDPDIQFDSCGICHHCQSYDRAIKERVLTGTDAEAHLRSLAAEIQTRGRSKDYDCIIGVSGGVDSTYVAYKMKTLGLRPLAVHLDNGWDSELAVKNIENVLKKLGIELYTHVIDWEEFRDLQLSFLKASTPDSEIPTDHAIVALMYQMARKLGLRHIISGCNVRTESHLPPAWSQGHNDWRYIKCIQHRFGRLPLKTFPHRTLFRRLIDNYCIQWIDILNFLDYNKQHAMEILEKELAWRYYGGKHYESIYTRFYQGYILPKKFGFDKRRTHLSSLICSEEISRDEALRELGKEPYPAKLQVEDREYVVKKLGITETEFEAIMHAPPKTFHDYPSYASNPIVRFLRTLLRRAT